MFSPVNQAFSLWLLLFSSSLFFFHKFVFYPSPLSLSFSLFLSLYLPPPPVGVKGFWQAVHVTPDISHGERRWWMGVKDGGMWRFMWTRQRKLLQGQSHLVLRWPPGTLCVCVCLLCVSPLAGHLLHNTSGRLVVVAALTAFCGRLQVSFLYFWRWLSENNRWYVIVWACVIFSFLSGL